MDSAEAELQTVHRALATAVLRNVADLESVEVLFGQPVESRQASRSMFPDFTPYQGVPVRHRGMVGHRHAAPELATVVAGRCHVMIEDMLYEARRGDWLLVRSHAFHAEAPLPEDNAFATFWFTPTMLPKRLMQLCLHRFDSEGDHRLYRAESGRDMPTAERASLSRVMCTPWRSVIEAQVFLVEVIDWCLRHLVPWRSSRIRHRNPQVSKVQRLLWSVGRKRSVREIAEQLGLTPNYLSSLFRRETGMTIRTFVREAKMDEACRLLAHTHRSIKEIAVHLGYSDTAHFSAAFRRATGVSPTRFRRQQAERMAE